AEQPHRVAAAAEQADIDLGQAHRCLFGRDEDVTERDHRQAGAERGAVDRADYRLGAFPDGMEAFARAARMGRQVIVGGSGSVFGPLAGAVVVVLMEKAPGWEPRSITAASLRPPTARAARHWAVTVTLVCSLAGVHAA